MVMDEASNMMKIALDGQSVREGREGTPEKKKKIHFLRLWLEWR